MRDTDDMFKQPERGRFGDNEQAPNRARVSGASDLIDLTLELRQEKPLAIAVTNPAKPCGKWIWLPKSQIEFEGKGVGIAIVTLPSWIAKEKGLI